jgi:hypothetical protein
MRCTLFPLFLFAGTFALGQASPAAPFPSEPLGQARTPWTVPGGDWSKLPPRWNPGLAPQPTTVFEAPPAGPLARLGDSSIDPQMILHPTAKDLGAQPAGTLVAQNLYPGLRYLPIDTEQCAPNGGPLSTTWPKLKAEPIPITWPKFKMEPTAKNPATALSWPKR